MTAKKEILLNHLVAPREGSVFYWKDIIVWLRRTAQEIDTIRDQIATILDQDVECAVAENAGKYELETRVSWNDPVADNNLYTLAMLNGAAAFKKHFPDTVKTVQGIVDFFTQEHGKNLRGESDEALFSNLVSFTKTVIEKLMSETVTISSESKAKLQELSWDIMAIEKFKERWANTPVAA